ncbi:MAG: tRNA guanosine(34) transglycosylase Tgt [Spirochaetaceae bacterium]|nr:MAG: tRNA guanosine(34) transglycosylase Tgt [Spirochaetaceae bacterium]
MTSSTNHLTIIHKDPHSHARSGTLSLPHGLVQTPAFMPVGTAASVKAVGHREVERLGYRLILGNTYHLFLRPGLDIIQRAGGLHAFSNWPHNILTDSGGYQVFSLAPFRKIKDEGAYFRSHIDGSYHTLTPERVVRIQEGFGSDVQMVLDVCTGFDAPRKEAEAALKTTSAWARRAYDEYSMTDDAYQGLLFGIVQGNFHHDLRQQSAEEITSIPFPGFAIGGLSVGEPFEVFQEFLTSTAQLLPADKPRYVMGIGTPEYILAAVENGIDMFDCVFPTRIARNGTIFTRDGRIALKNERFKDDFGPLDPDTPDAFTAGYSRAYVRHLLKASEILAPMIATVHNLNFLAVMMSEIRSAIAAGQFTEYKESFLRRYKQGTTHG